MNLKTGRPDRFSEDEGALATIRTCLAFAILALGVAGSLVAVPTAIWALLQRGFH